MPLIFDHIGVVAADIDDAARALAATVEGTGFTRRFDDSGLGVSVRFVRDASGTVFECIAPLGETSPVTRTLESKANLLNQIAYRTGSLADAAVTLRAAGNLPLGKPSPAMAFGDADVQFFWSPLGFVVELIEAPEHRHEFFETLEQAS